jgi:hypothetical protein
MMRSHASFSWSILALVSGTRYAAFSSDACFDQKGATMRYLNRFGGTVGVTAALMLIGWAPSAEAMTSLSSVLDVQTASSVALDGGERSGSVLGSVLGSDRESSVLTLLTLRPTLQQRRGGGGRRAAPARGGGGGRVAVPRGGGRPGGGGGRPVYGRGGRYYAPYYGFGFGYGYGYPWGYPYYGGGYYAGSYSYTGSVRLKVKPKSAEVLVDGYFVGTVDDFDGSFQSLKLEPGPKNIQVRAPGFESLTLDVRILPGRKITYEQNMIVGNPGPPPAPSAAAARPGQRPPERGVEVGRPVPSTPNVAERQSPADAANAAAYTQQPQIYGGVRLRVKPRDAQVFVGGYFVGTVDDFDGGKGLPLESGPQSIEIRAAGYEPLEIEVRILPDETITYEGDMTPVPGQQMD